ncbi:MAG TPA: enolase C-terminal domain-like protein [Burkholderiales bacterium]|nr:enolase C-terminal domain-like protein [Burkholderiales bacterium]
MNYIIVAARLTATANRPPMTIAHINLYRLRVPLATPYRLSFGPVLAFDTVLVEMRDENGRTGLGEATYLTGYTDETIEGGWALAQGLATGIVSMATTAVAAQLKPHFQAAPFTATAFNTAAEMAMNHRTLALEETTRVPVLGLLHATETAAIEIESQQLFDQGFTTLKVKVGFDASRDAAMVKRVQSVIGDRARIRLDANQGYSREDACRFVAALDPRGIELFEQPCVAGDWESALAVACIAPVPMMLDESIYGLDDIRRAAELKAARFIKVKLMKLGGLDRLAAAIDVIRDCGMEPVLGNGVACAIGCWMEACVARARINNAGEMNGFLKPVETLLTNPLKFERGAIVLEAGFSPALDDSAVARCTLERREFS